MVEEEHKCPACENHAGFRGLYRAVAGHLSTFKVAAEQTVGSDLKLSTTGSFQRCESIGKQPNAGKQNNGRKKYENSTPVGCFFNPSQRCFILALDNNEFIETQHKQHCPFFVHLETSDLNLSL